MKKLVLMGVMLMIFPTFSFAQNSRKTYTGQIMDSACAKMGNHDAGYKMTGTSTPKACTLVCVKGGSTFVLYNGEDKTTYKLDNQKEPRRFAGENVKVSGTLNQATDTIHVDSIKAGS